MCVGAMDIFGMPIMMVITQMIEHGIARTAILSSIFSMSKEKIKSHSILLISHVRFGGLTIWSGAVKVADYWNESETNAVLAEIRTVEAIYES